MRINSQDLGRQLQQGLQSVYLVSGDETLLVQECCDAIRQSCQQAGFSEREILHVDKQFDWQTLLASAQSMSLFAEKKLLELRMPSGKPGDAGSKALQQFCQINPDDTILLIICNKLEQAVTRSKWYKTIEQQGATVPVWPIQAKQLPQWLQQRLQKAGLQADRDAIQLLAERTEGNLLAAAQEIDKLALLHGEGKLDAATVIRSVGNNARYDLFQFIDTVLLGKPAKAVKMLQGLRGEGTDASVICWALARELRLLFECQQQIAAGNGMERVLQQAKVWDRRKPIVKQALGRVTLAELPTMFAQLAQVDKLNKGMQTGNNWQQLESLVLAMAGVRLAADKVL